MFPLHEDTILVLALLTAGGAMAVFISWHGRVFSWACAILFFVALIWPWPIALALGLDPFTTLMAIRYGGFTLLALCAGAVWGLAARRVTAGALAFAVACLPALGGAAYLLERQRVPDAACAERALFGIGGISIAVPRSLSVRSVQAGDDAPKQAWDGFYGPETGAKPDVRRLCQASAGGRNQLQVQHLMISSSWSGRARRADCETGQVPEDLASFCAALERTQLTVVQLYARPDGMPVPTLSLFDGDAVAGRISAGETAGYLCKDGATGPQTRYCTIWLQLTPEVLAVASAKLGPASNKETPLADARVVLRGLMTHLRP
jgi:hypothetical protein